MSLKNIKLIFSLLVFNFIIVSTNDLPEGLVPCMDHKDCDDLKNATCSENGICECNQSIYICEEITYEVSNRIGGKCKESKNCNVNDSECGRQKKCICKNGYVSSIDRRKCLKKAKNLGDPCEEDNQCSSAISSTFCSNKNCICKNNTHEHKGLCFRTAALGSACSRNEECSSTAFSSCVDSKCSCSETHVAINLKCLQIPQDIGNSCEEDTQCTTAFGHGSHCSQRTCQCKDLYHYKEKGNTCVRDIFLNEICQNHSDCYQPGVEASRLMCILGVCKCKSSYREENGYCVESDASRGISTFRVGRPQLFMLYVFIAYIIIVKV